MRVFEHCGISDAALTPRMLEDSHAGLRIHTLPSNNTSWVILMNSLKSMLRDRVLVGLTTQHVTTPWLAQLYKNAGADFVYIEYEHSFMNEADLADYVLTCRMAGLPVVAKVPECSRTHVAKL